MKKLLLLLSIPVLMLTSCKNGDDTTYSVTVTSGGNGTAKASVKEAEITSASEGTIITVTATPDSGYIFDKWSSESGVRFSNPTVPSTTFMMPAADIVIKADFKTATNHTITLIDDNKGTLLATIDGTPVAEAGEDAIVTISATPHDGYSFSKWTSSEVTFADAKAGTTTFTMPYADVTIRAEFTEIADFDIFTKLTDTDFKAYCQQFDTDGNGKLSFREANKVTYISLIGRSAASLDGIEYFKKLKELHCNGNDLTSLDMSKNPDLFRLYCGGNSLEVLNLSGCAALERFGSNDNKLTSIDLSGCTSLINIECANNLLATLDLSECPSLGSLRCSNNLLTALDLSSNPNLFELYCNSNQLTSLDIAPNTALAQMSCSDNRMTALDITTMATYRLYDDDLYDVWCGAQTTDGTTAQMLTLTMRANQKARWESTLADHETNINVTLSE